MTLVRWEPFREMNSFRRQMDELFDNMNSIAKVDQGRMAPWEPAVEINETEDKMILRAEVLGVDPNNLDIKQSCCTTMMGQL